MPTPSRLRSAARVRAWGILSTALRRLYIAIGEWLSRAERAHCAAIRAELNAHHRPREITR